VAALPDRYSESLIDLRDLTVDQLAGLLEEETASWRAELDWDFRASADLVRRFIQLRSLNGFALVAGGAIAGYSYYVAEDGKGLIGDFYMRTPFRAPERHARLLQVVLDAMWRTPGTHRVEAQLMMLLRATPGALSTPPLYAVRPLVPLVSAPVFGRIARLDPRPPCPRNGHRIRTLGGKLAR